jgi:hypothetical protein
MPLKDVCVKRCYYDLITAGKGHCGQCCGPQDLARLLTESPCVMTTEVLDIRQLVQSPAKLAKPSATKIS